ncbi:hypothetical protein JK628_06875 [Shewanella sp. KX20019]|uniref:hypothetical protein n=1 Tax=Shewanella sp. KX20019 TaxID=2803864 RepID=UPI00192518F3|nr:hypothetical protein [Shewanella sp. KX20019]QQX81578.1 hypothetical protein JK628_06875 [Shewanella sp. KX20019]
MANNDSQNNHQNSVRPIFRILTGALFLFGVYGVYLIALVKYSIFTSSGFSLGFIFSGLISFTVFIIWVYVSGYVTLKGKLPSGKNT